jgi:hypothetical protein
MDYKVSPEVQGRFLYPYKTLPEVQGRFLYPCKTLPEKILLKSSGLSSSGFLLQH